MEWKKALGTGLLVFVVICLSGEEKEDPSLRLKIGNKGLKNKLLAISPGVLYSAKQGRAIPFEKMIEEIRTIRFVYIGESHDSLPAHKIQARIIQALSDREKSLGIAMEMFPETVQEALNKWSLGILTEEEFIREARWYVNWNFNFGFYRDIFLLAREKKIPMFGLNAPRELIKKIRMSGWEALADEDKSIVPRPDLSHEEHRILIRTIFEQAEIPSHMKGGNFEEAFEGLYRAQSAWDEVMASNAHKAHERENAQIVVLAGSGHLLYNLGANRRVFEKNRLPFATVLCVAVPEEKKELLVSRSLADYIWGLHEEERPAFPSVGLSFKKVEGLENIVIDAMPVGGVASPEDFHKGDIVLSVDGRAYSDINELRIYLSVFQWGDEVKFCLLRLGEEREAVLKFEMQEESESPS